MTANQETQETYVAPETIAALIKIVKIDLEYYPEGDPASRYDIDVLVEFSGVLFALRYQNDAAEQGGFGLSGSHVTGDDTDALIFALSEHFGLTEHFGLSERGRRDQDCDDEGYFMFYNGVVLATKAAAYEAWPGVEEDDDDEDDEGA